MKVKLSELFDASSIQIKEDISKIDEVLEYEQILLSISKAIIQYRKDNKLRQKDLAEILNTNQVMISKLERGNYNPTIKNLYNISRKLTKSSDLFISILKDIITNLYKSKEIKYSIQFKKYEIYKYNNKKDKITYLVNNNNINKYGGIIYEGFNSTSRLSANG